MIITLIISAQKPVTLGLPEIPGEKVNAPFNLGSVEFTYGNAIDTVYFDPAFGVMSRGWNSTVLNPEAFYEYRITPAEGASLSLNQFRLDISLGRGEMCTAVNYSTDGFRTEGIPIGKPLFFTTTNPRTLTLTPDITISFPGTLSIRVYAWSARDKQVNFNLHNAIIDAIASGPQLLTIVENLPLVAEPEPNQPEIQLSSIPATLAVAPATDTAEIQKIPEPDETSMADAITPVQDTLAGKNNEFVMAPMGSVVISASGSWQVPVNVYEITVECWGGGGGGGGARYGAGGGGGGGAYNKVNFTTNVNPGDWYTITIGSGGTTGNNVNGGNGGTTSFTGLAGTITANGGSGGNRGSGSIIGNAYGTGGAGGSGGIYNGGSGGTSTGNGAGGGGGAGNNGNGTNGGNSATGTGGAGNPNAVPYIGGNGGAYRNNDGGGNNANIPAGGGGGARSSGSSTSRSGGTGARGQVIISWPDCVNPTIYSVTGGGTYCSGGNGLQVELNGSESDVTYQLYRDGNPVGAAINGTGGAISFGNQTIAGTYTVVATRTIGGCTSNMNGSAVITINPLPTITLGANPSVCSGTTSASLLYTDITGSPDQYSIDYNPAAEAVGFVDIINSILPASPLILMIPAGTPVAAYQGTLTVRNSSNGCVSSEYPISINVNPLPVAPNNASSDRTDFCADDPGSISLTVTGGSGTTVRWFTGSCGGTVIGTGSPLTIDSPITTTTYYARWETSDCGVSACVEITVTVRPTPVTPASVSSNINNICVNAGGTITLTATGGSGTTLRWFSGSCGGTDIGTGVSITIPSPVLTTNYYARWENDCGNSSCASTSVTVIQLPITPVSAESDRSGFCADDAGNITLTANGGSGATLKWFTGSCGGIEIGNVNPLTISSPTITTTYYARWENICGVSDCAEVTVDVIPLPVAPTTVSVDRNGFCYNDTGNIILTATGGSGDQLEWYTGSCGGVFTGTGNNLSIASPDVTTTFYVFWTNICGTSSCQSVTVTVNVVTPGTISADQTICYGGDPALITSTMAGTGMGNISYRWEISVTPFTDWNPIAGATGATYDPPAGLTETTHFRRISVSDYNGGCESAPTSIVIIKVQSVPAPGEIAEDQYVCFGGSTAPLYSVVDGTGDGTITYRWERSVSPFTVWTTIAGATTAGYNPGPLAFTTQFRRYTVSTISGVACESAISNVVTITIQDIAVTAGSIGYSQTICYNETPDNLVSIVDGTATAGADVTYQWQVSTGFWTDIPGETGEGLNISIPHTVTTQYRRRTIATLAGNSCFSNWSVAVTITVIRPVTPGAIAADQTICNGTTPVPLSSVLAGTSPGATITYQWEQSINGGVTWTVITLGATPGYAPGMLTQTTWFRRVTVATMNGHECFSEPTNNVIITVQDVVQPGSVAASQTICYGATPAPLTSVEPGSGSSTPAYSWEYSTNNGTTWVPIAGANSSGYTPGVLTQTTWYRRITTCTVNGVSCSAATVHIIISVQGQVIPPVASSNQTICFDTKPLPLNRTNASGGSGSFSYQWQTSTDNIIWTDIAGQTGMTYQPPVLNITTYYRVVATSIGTPSCGDSFSNVVTITVRAPLTAPVICCDQVVCWGNAADPITISIPPAGGAGNYSYQWQVSNNETGPWANVAGAVFQAYTPTVFDRYYRLVVTDLCGIIYSLPVHIMSAASFSFTFNESGIPNSPLCPGSSFNYHITSVTVSITGKYIRYSWSADPTYISPSTGNNYGDEDCWLFGLLCIYFADITYTVHNSTNVNVTTTIDVTPTLYNSNGTVYCNLTPQSFNVTIRPFMLACPADITANTSPGSCSAQVSIPNIQWVDNSCTSTVNWTMSGATSGSGTGNMGLRTFNQGVTTITYSSTLNGQSTSCSFTVTVTDNEAPTITCPANITRNTDLNQCAASIATPNPTFSDNCGGAAGVSILIWSMSGATSNTSPITGINYVGTQTFNPGVTTIIYSAEDVSGNKSTCSYTVTVTDNQSPTFTFCPSNYIMDTDPGVCNATFDPADPVVTDNCYDLLAVTWVMSGATTGNSPATGINFLGNTTFNTGTTTIMYTALDPGGNIATCIITVNVDDNELPQFVFCPSGYSVNSEPGRCYATILTQDPEIFDNCGISALTWAISGSTTGTGSGNIGAFTFNTGTSTVVYTLSDNSTPPHSSECTYDVTVTDTQLPTMSCPVAQTRNTDPGVCSYTVVGNEFDPVNIVENCPGYTLSNNYNGGSTLAGAVFPSGTTTVRWVLIDEGMNNTECYILVTIVDNQAPEITSCAPAQTASAGAGCQAIVPDVTGMIVVTDNCTNPGNLAISQNPAHGTLVGIGVTTITISVRDENDLTTSCQTTFTVTDDTAPVFADCPTTPGDLGCNPATLPDEAMAIANAGAVADNCSTPTLSATGSSITNTGCDYAQLWTVMATDGANTVECMVTFNWIQDVLTPVITTTATNSNLGCNPIITVPEFTGTDNCEGTITPQVTSAGPTNIGCDYSQTWTANYTDGCGNVATPASITYTWVEDTEGPVINCAPGSVTVPADAGETFASNVVVPTPATSDNCTGTVTIYWTSSDAAQGNGVGPFPSVNIFLTGTTTITWTAEDACDNESSCTFFVSVTANDPPDISCAADVVINTDAGLCSALVNPDEPTINAGNPISWSWTMTGAATDAGNGPIDLYTFTAGTTSITWTATNASGTAECTQTITVTDNEPPIFTLPLLDSGYCVEGFIEAIFNPGGAYYVNDLFFTDMSTPARRDYFILNPVELLDITGISDNCPGQVSISWDIDFGNNGSTDLSGTGQISLTTPIYFPLGDNLISWIITDSNGNFSTGTTILRVLPRPEILD